MAADQRLDRLGERRRRPGSIAVGGTRERLKCAGNDRIEPDFNGPLTRVYNFVFFFRIPVIGGNEIPFRNFGEFYPNFFEF